jgi:hypothetical protein
MKNSSRWRRRGAVLAVLAIAGPCFAIPGPGATASASASSVERSIYPVVDATTVRGTKATPAVEDCGLSKPEIRPRHLTLACADANSLGDDLVWAKWASSGASATGTFTWNTCVPYCAASKKWDKASARFVLGDPVETTAGWLFEKLVVHVTGKLPAKMSVTLTVSEKPVPK